jgi:RNA 2',3'-cyclic 3'-phosphodiesterase
MTQPDSISDDLSSDVLRLFIGIACPHLAKVAGVLQELRQSVLHPPPEVRIVPENNLHITLKFLGTLQRSSIERIAATLDRLALDTNPFVISLAGAGAFNDALWLGVDPCDSLTKLASLINQQLEPLGFPPEKRPFIAHLTVARLKRKAGPELQTWLEQHQHGSWGSVKVQEMHLYQSETLNTGTRYSILHTAKFMRTG